MNIKMSLNLLGKVFLCEAALLFIPAIISIFHNESILGFSAAIFIATILGVGFILIKPTTKTIYSKEGFLVCALSWIGLSLVGAVPFVVERWIPSYIDAFFEIVSGFTTTGATILSDFSHKGTYGLFFWRSFSHFIGGMGVLVFVLAIIPLSSERSMNLMRAEVPGPVVGKIVPKLKNTAIILYVIYVGLTLLQVVFLLIGGMSIYEAFIHAFATAGTGGFSNRAGSLAEFSPYIQYVTSIFMLIFATNFNLHYYILLKQVKAVIKDEEYRVYLIIVALFTAAITINTISMFSSAEESFRIAFFQVSSIISSTGFVTIDLVKLPEFSQVLLVILMFIGACAGSTGGGLKISRIIIVLKSYINEVKRLIRPSEVVKVRINDIALPDPIVRSTLIFFCIYLTITAISIIIIALDGFDFATTCTAVISCMGNMGPGLWKGSCFEMFSDLSKITLSINMLLGRLEIFPIIVLFTPSVWKSRMK